MKMSVRLTLKVSYKEFPLKGYCKKYAMRNATHFHSEKTPSSLPVCFSVSVCLVLYCSSIDVESRAVFALYNGGMNGQ